MIIIIIIIVIINIIITWSVHILSKLTKAYTLIFLCTVYVSQIT